MARSLADVAPQIVALADADARAMRSAPPLAPLDLPIAPEPGADPADVIAWLKACNDASGGGRSEPFSRATHTRLRAYLAELPDEVLREAWAALDVQLGAIAPPARERWWLVGRLTRHSRELGPAVRAWVHELSQGGAA
jgi:hypothetical protein